MGVWQIRHWFCFLRCSRLFLRGLGNSFFFFCGITSGYQESIGFLLICLITLLQNKCICSKITYISYLNPCPKPCKEDWFKQQRRPCLGGMTKNIKGVYKNSNRLEWLLCSCNYKHTLMNSNKLLLVIRETINHLKYVPQTLQFWK